MRHERGMENNVVFGGMSGMRKRGRLRTRWLDKLKTIKGSTYMRLDARERQHGEVLQRMMQ